VRERDRRTITLIWVAVTAVLSLILVVRGALLFALLLSAVAGVGLVAWLRVTHPRGERKPPLGIFFDDLDEEGPAGDAVGAATEAGPPAVAGPATAPIPARPVPPTARRVPPGGDGPAAEVIDLRRTPRREPAPATSGTGAPGDHDAVVPDEAVAASQQAADARGKGTGNDKGNGDGEVAAELSEHHVRLLRQVQVKLRDYQ
jgi:hypothetical protein